MRKGYYSSWTNKDVLRVYRTINQEKSRNPAITQMKKELKEEINDRKQRGFMNKSAGKTINRSRDPFSFESYRIKGFDF